MQFPNYITILYMLVCTAAIDHFTVSCLVAWPLNESEAGVDLVLIETLLLFICKFLLLMTRSSILHLKIQIGQNHYKDLNTVSMILDPGLLQTSWSSTMEKRRLFTLSPALQGKHRHCPLQHVVEALRLYRNQKLKVLDSR